MCITDIYLSRFDHDKFTDRQKLLEKIIFTGGIGLLYIIAGIALEIQFGIMNELYIMVYCFFVSITAFAISLKKNNQMIAILAIMAGLSMPFILEDAYETPIAVLYSSLVITCSILLYLYHGWFLLLVISAFCFWGTIDLHNELAVSRHDTDIIRTAVFVHWLEFWLSTMVREHFLSPFSAIIPKYLSSASQPLTRLMESQPLPLKSSSSGSAESATTLEQAAPINQRQSPKPFDNPKYQVNKELKYMSTKRTILFNLLILLVCEHLLASTYFNVAYWAHWALLKGTLYGIAAAGFSIWGKKHPNFDAKNLIYPNYVVSVLLLSIGIWLQLSGDLRYFALSVEAFTIVLISNKTKDVIGMISGCVIWLYTLSWTIYILVLTVPDTTILNKEAIMHTIVIGMIAIQSHVINNIYFKLVFEGIVHALLNMLLYREFAHSMNYLYFVTALYPAAVQIYAYLKGDGEYVTIIRMLFGDILWLWLFISQTLPRLLLIETFNFLPFSSITSIMDVFVVVLALQITMIQDHRLQGSTRLMYLVMCNATIVSLIYRDSGSTVLTHILLALYTITILLIAWLWNSTSLKLGGILTILTLIIDYLLFGFTSDVLRKGAIALFAGMVAIGFIVLPSNPTTRPDPIAARMRSLSRSGIYNVSAKKFDIPASPIR